MPAEMTPEQGSGRYYNAVEEMYLGARDADAYYSGNSLSTEEMRALTEGPEAWLAAFPPPRSGDAKGVSRFAGRPGHRWGWLIQRTSWEDFTHAVVPEKGPLTAVYDGSLDSAAAQYIHTQRAAAVRDVKECS